MPTDFCMGWFNIKNSQLIRETTMAKICRKDAANSVYGKFRKLATKSGSQNQAKYEETFSSGGHFNHDNHRGE